MFYDKFSHICHERDVSPTTVLKEIGLSTSKLTAWKNGSPPKEIYVKKIAEYFDISADYLLGHIKVDVEIKSQSLLSIIKNVLIANPQRIVSLRTGRNILDSERNIISKYMRCSLSYLFGKEQQYVQQENDTPITFSDLEASTLIFDVLDRCASNEEYMTLQIQISRIIAHNLYQKEIHKEDLKEICKLVGAKLDFIYDGKESFDSTQNFGFNFSDLMRIWCDFKDRGITIEYLLTGVDVPKKA